MEYQLEKYRDRLIQCNQVVHVNDWGVKVYAVTKQPAFGAHEVLNNAIEKLPEWTKLADETPLETYKTAILIVHEAREGVWLLFNWWTGGEMLDTRLFFADYESKEIKSSGHGNGLKCIWEIEIFAHERQAWIQQVLNKFAAPDFNGYLNNAYSVNP